MKINEVVSLAEIDGVDKYKKGTYKLSGGLTGKGGQIGDVVSMVERHYKAWQSIIAKNANLAKENPRGLLQAWIERFYGGSSAKISWKKATVSGGVSDNRKGANAILRIVILITLKPSSSVEMQAYLEQVVDKLPDPIKKEVDDEMPAPTQEPNPSAAQNQTPKRVQYQAGDQVTWTTAKGNTASGVVTGKEVKPGYTQVKTKRGALIAVDFNKTQHTHQAGTN